VEAGLAYTGWSWLAVPLQALTALVAARLGLRLLVALALLPLVVEVLLAIANLFIATSHID
jgi:hypothetical protein